jgi:hypothetical protein
MQSPPKSASPAKDLDPDLKRLRTPPTPGTTETVTHLPPAHKRLKRCMSVAFPAVKKEDDHDEETQEKEDEQDKQDKDVKDNDKEEKSDAIDKLTSALAIEFVERVMSLLKSKRVSPGALLAVFDQLEALPHAEMPVPSNAREFGIKHMLMIDDLFKATLKAQDKAIEDWNSTPWQKRFMDNMRVVNGLQQKQEDGVLEDGCSICAVAKTECMKQDEHFGPHGESPPYSVCPYCSKNFCNRYYSAHALKIHVAAEHPEK